MGCGPSHAEKAQEFLVDQTLAVHRRRAPRQVLAASAPREDWWPLSLERDGFLWRGMHAGRKPFALITPTGARFLDWWPGTEPLDLINIQHASASGLLIAVAADSDSGGLLLVWNFEERRCLWARATPQVHKINHLILQDGLVSVHMKGRVRHCQVFDAHTGEHRRCFSLAPKYWAMYPSGRILVIVDRRLTIRRCDGERVCDVELPEEVSSEYRPGLVGGNEFLCVQLTSRHVFVSVTRGGVYDTLPPSTGPCPSAFTFRAHGDAVTVEVGACCTDPRCGCGAPPRAARTFPCESNLVWMPDPWWLARGECADIARAVAAIDRLPAAEPGFLGLVRAVLVGFVSEDARLFAMALQS